MPALMLVRKRGNIVEEFYKGELRLEKIAVPSTCLMFRILRKPKGQNWVSLNCMKIKNK